MSENMKFLRMDTSTNSEVTSSEHPEHKQTVSAPVFYTFHFQYTNKTKKCKPYVILSRTLISLLPGKHIENVWYKQIFIHFSMVSEGNMKEFLPKNPEDVNERIHVKC